MDIGMTLLMTFTPGLQAAKQDAWISMLVAGCIAVLIAVVTTKLVLLHPEQTFIQFSQTIMGKWLGKIVSDISYHNPKSYLNFTAER